MSTGRALRIQRDSDLGMARQRRKLTRREKTFGREGAAIFIAISVLAIRATNLFSDLGVLALVYSAWLGVLVAVLGICPWCWARSDDRLSAAPAGNRVACQRPEDP